MDTIKIKYPIDPISSRFKPRNSENVKSYIFAIQKIPDSEAAAIENFDQAIADFQAGRPT